VDAYSRFLALGLLASALPGLLPVLASRLLRKARG
jgi:hypothetical protein